MIEPRSWLAAGASGWIRTGTPLVLFVALGLPAGAVGVAWPQMRASLGAPLAGLGSLAGCLHGGLFRRERRQRIPWGPSRNGCAAGGGVRARCRRLAGAERHDSV